MSGGIQTIQIEVQGRGGASSVRLGAGHDDTRMGLTHTPGSCPPASLPFVLAVASGRTDSGRALFPPALGRQLVEADLKKSVRHGAMHVRDARASAAASNAGHGSRTPGVNSIRQGFREPVFHVHSKSQHKTLMAARANGQAVPVLRTFS